MSYYASHQYDRAIEQSQKTLEIEPHFWMAHYDLGVVYVRKAKYEEAITEFQKAVSGSPRNPYMVGYLGFAYAAAGKKAEAERRLKELNELSRHRFVPSFSKAVVYIGLGEKDRAFEWLARAYEEREGWLVNNVKLDPSFDSLRSDSRYADLMRRVGLPP